MDIEITREDFEAYVQVQMSGVTNMMIVHVVEDLSGLEKEKIFAIMKQYGKLKEKYGIKEEPNPDIEPGNYVHDKLDENVSGVVIDMDEDTITIELDGDDAIEVELPRGRVIFDEVGVA